MKPWLQVVGVFLAVIVVSSILIAIWAYDWRFWLKVSITAIIPLLLLIRYDKFLEEN